MPRYTDRNRRHLAESELSPEARAAAQARLAARQTPEYREGLARDVEGYQSEFPAATVDDPLLDLLAELRLERERQGLSLLDIQERTGIDRATVCKLETGKIANPTYNSLRTLAAALGKRLTLGLTDVTEFRGE